MRGDLLLLSLDSTLPQVRIQDVTIGASTLQSFLDSLHDPRCLYTAFTFYKSATNSTTPRPSDNTRAQRLDQLHLMSLLPWVAMGCYGLLSHLIQQISYYMAARAIYQVLALYVVRALRPTVLELTSCNANIWYMTLAICND